MRYLLLVLFIFSCVAPVQAQDAEKKQGPLMVLRKPIDMDYGASRLLMVVFNHNTHTDYACILCHHKRPVNGPLYAPCTTEGCHSIPGARQRGKDSMFMAYHAPSKRRSCYGCHKMEAPSHPSFVGCHPCHGQLKDIATAVSQQSGSN